MPPEFSSTPEPLPRRVRFVLKGYAAFALTMILFSFLALLFLEGYSDSLFFISGGQMFQLPFGSSSDFFLDSLYLLISLAFSSSGFLDSLDLLISLASLFLVSLYYVGLFRLQRWTVPVTIILFIVATLESFYNTIFFIVLGNSFTEIALGTAYLVPYFFFAAVLWLSVKYRHELLGPAKKLAVQVPVILFLFLSIISLLLPFFIFTEIPYLD